MRVATVLLDMNNNYVMLDGALPPRPDFDKQLLSSIIAGQSVSPRGYRLLPCSMQSSVSIGGLLDDNFPITIPEIANADLLIVSRSTTKGLGKPFRLEEFTRIVKEERLELWKRK